MACSFMLALSLCSVRKSHIAVGLMISLRFIIQAHDY